MEVLLMKNIGKVFLVLFEGWDFCYNFIRAERYVHWLQYDYV